MKSAGQHEQAGGGELPKSRVLCILVRRFLCNVHDKRALTGLCLLVTSLLSQIRVPWHSQLHNSTQKKHTSIYIYIVIGLSLHIHSSIYLRHYQNISEINTTLPDAVAKTLRRGYYCSVSFVDWMVGRILQSVSDLGLRHNTVISFIGDHEPAPGRAGAVGQAHQLRGGHAGTLAAAHTRAH